MHRLYGALPWQRVVAPGEAYASTGFPLSQALSVRLASAQNLIRLDAALAAEFLDQIGKPRAVGSETKNVALGETLSQIRRNGADGFYKGDVAARIVAYSAAQGGGISGGELAASAAARRGAVRGAGSFVIWLPGARTGAGAFSGGCWTIFRAHRPRAIQRWRARCISPWRLRRRQLSGRSGVDRICRGGCGGAAASCAVTLNGPFGSGRTAAAPAWCWRDAFKPGRPGQRLPDAGDRHAGGRWAWRAQARAVRTARRRRWLRCWMRRPGGRWASAAICAARAGAL